MDFVNEQDIVRFQIGQQGCQIARAFQYRPGRLAQVHTQFARDNVRQRGFAETRRPEQQRVVERFAAVFRRLNKNIQLLFGLVLADIIRQKFGAQGAFQLFLLGGQFLCGD